jgi:hypothetical protein
MKLKRTLLVDWADDNCRHLSDSITRRLLLIYSQHNQPILFSKRCKKAYENCCARMEEQREFRSKWAVDSLAVFLQTRTSNIQIKNIRDELRKEFFDEVLPETLRKLVAERDKRIEKEPFLSAVRKHPDFVFLLNYYLRDETYNDKPYEEFLKIAERIFN